MHGATQGHVLQRALFLQRLTSLLGPIDQMDDELDRAAARSRCG